MNYKNLFSPANYLITFLLLAFTFTSCAFKSIKRSKGIEYLKEDSLTRTALQKLNVFAPRNKKIKKDVLIFIHGGNWNSGKRSLYNFLGSRMARKGIVAVIIDYPLSPKATYKEMAFACAASVKWVKENIENYGGDSSRIFVSGHSAGGHLAALISLDNKYFDSLGITDPIKGAILIDAAALDMYTYLKETGLDEDHTYMNTFTKDPVEWKNASPVYYLHPGMPEFLIYQGGKTYPSIKQANELFLKQLLPLAPNTAHYIIKGKKHVAMITQFFNTGNHRYNEMIKFMKSVK